MFYFIPSWYQDDRKWYREIPSWSRTFEHLTFDDTINQMKMFQMSQEEAQLIVLNYQPQLRYFLHKQGLKHGHYWSFFDDVQNVKSTQTKPIDFKDFSWPEGVEFSYNPFFILATVKQETLAEIHFGDNGNLLRIDFSKDKQRDKSYYFDDRGFLSSILYFKSGEPDYQDYLNEYGVWQVREKIGQEEKAIVINQYADHQFKQSVYDSWEDLIEERLAIFKQKVVKNDDIVVLSAHHQHNQLVMNVFKDLKIIQSFFSYRQDLIDDKDIEVMAQHSDLFIVDTERKETEVSERLAKASNRDFSIQRMTPFDTRLRLGRSQELKQLIIYWLIDGISDQVYEVALNSLLDLMRKDPLVQLKIISYQPYKNLDFLNQQLLTRLERDPEDVERFLGLVEGENENNLPGDEQYELTAISFEKISNENQLIIAMDPARLVLDLSETPDLYTQIASLSAGLPQINQVKTEYVTHEKNGWILSDITELEKAIRYYFDGLANWNESLVYAVQKMGDYTSGRLIKQWKELLGIENG